MMKKNANVLHRLAVSTVNQTNPYRSCLQGDVGMFTAEQLRNLSDAVLDKKINGNWYKFLNIPVLH